MANRTALATGLAVLTGVGLSAGCQVQAEFSAGWKRGTGETALATTMVRSEGRALLSAWFANGDTEVSQMWYERPDGRVDTWRYVSGPNGVQDNRRRDLTPKRAAAVKRDLNDLPPARITTVQDVLIVDVFEKPGPHRLAVPRYYDRRHLPQAVADLFAATGAPLAPSASDPGEYYPPDGDWSRLPANR